MAAISALANFLLGLGRNFLTWAYNILVDLVNAAISTFAIFCTSIAGMFPSVPPPTVESAPLGDVMEMCVVALNWVFPMGAVVGALGFIVAAYLAYWFIAPIARWAKLLS